MIMHDKPFSDIAFAEYLAQEKIMGSRCSSCGRVFVPPRPICLECGSSSLEWTEMPRKGTLAAFTCITVPPPSMAAKGYGRQNPYCTGVVELDGGGRVVARIEGVPADQPETIRIGQPMEAIFMAPEKEGEETILAFRPS
jgi:hypothetical protein